MFIIKPSEENPDGRVFFIKGLKARTAEKRRMPYAHT